MDVNVLLKENVPEKAVNALAKELIHLGKSSRVKILEYRKTPWHSMPGLIEHDLYLEISDPDQPGDSELVWLWFSMKDGRILGKVYLKRVSSYLVRKFARLGGGTGA